MVLPLIPLAYGLMAGGALMGASSNLYSQAKQRDLYRYQRGGYERQLQDWYKNVPNRRIRYPELSYPGRIRALDTGISQSYSASIGSIGSALGFGGGSVLSYQRGINYVRHPGLYNSNPVTSRWL